MTQCSFCAFHDRHSHYCYPYGSVGREAHREKNHDIKAEVGGVDNTVEYKYKEVDEDDGISVKNTPRG